MSETYNPETKTFERLEALEIEARGIAKKRDAAENADERQMLDRQLKEVEDEIDQIKKQLKP